MRQPARPSNNDLLKEMMSRNDTEAGGKKDEFGSDSDEMDPDAMFGNVSQQQQNRYGRSMAITNPD